MNIIKRYTRYKIDEFGQVWHVRLNRKLNSILRDKYPRVNIWNDKNKKYEWVQISTLMQDNILSIPAHLTGVPSILLIVKYKNGNQSDCTKSNLQLELSKNRRFPYCNDCYRFHQPASKGGMCEL